MQTHEMLNTEQAADYLGLESHTLEVWRCTGRYGLPFFKVGGCVRYRKADLEEWLAAQRRGEVAVVAQGR